MELVTVKTKFQVVIPQSIREKMRMDVGDLLEVSLEDGKIIFTPKAVIDKHLAEGLLDLAQGRTHGPYANAKEAIAALETRTPKRARKARKAR
jgi:AbrB family looped-hinge helix DNA binding protein